MDYTIPFFIHFCHWNMIFLWLFLGKILHETCFDWKLFCWFGVYRRYKRIKYNIKKLKLWTTKIIINFQNYRIIQTQKLEENETNKNWRAKVNVRKMLGFVLLKFKLLIPTRRKISLHANNSVWKRGFRGKIPWNKTLL
jgi:hypothetical protein